jgi:hypothetical protein
MARTKRNRALMAEQLAGPRSSPNLKPCREFRQADIAKFAKPLNGAECKQCLAFFLQLDKEQQMMQLLREHGN